MTTKILALTDALGNLVRFVLLPGQRFDTVGVAPLIEGIAFGALIADKAFDSNDIIADLNQRGAKVVISQHPRRTTPLQIDTEMYKWRHLIENFFCKLKEFKRIAMRADLKRVASKRIYATYLSSCFYACRYRKTAAQLCATCISGQQVKPRRYCLEGALKRR